MPRNLREGARRLLLVALMLAAGIGIGNAWNAEPNVWLTYQVQSPGAAPVRVERCGDDDTREYFYRDGPDGTYFNIDLCFKAVQKNDLKFIPYATDEDGTSWIELKNSPQVGSYTRAVARSFDVPQADRGAAFALWQKAKWRTRFESLGQLAIGLVAFWLFCSLLAWIARRFLGLASARSTGHGA